MNDITSPADTHISLAHGNGGRYMRELIDTLFARHLDNPLLDVQTDAACLPPLDGELMVTTDGFTVQPLEFPGGTIGSLAVHGTVNDLAVSGAVPHYLTVSAFIEEGFEIAQLERIVASMAQAAAREGVSVVAGDTKVVRRGEGGGLYLSVAGIGVRAKDLRLGLDRIQAGDAVLVSGPVGDHGISVMLAREQFGLSGELRSDAASVLPLARALWPLAGLRFMRDPTRGGLATVMHEISRASKLRVRLRQPDIPVRGAVSSVCEMLGYDPLFLACEGRAVAIVNADDANEALARWRALPEGKHAAIIGRIESGRPDVVLETEFGGERLLDELEDAPLPRIC
ncbi:MAG TPA: hydrogenase expression/formation protein HypE [Gallionellaceae bacterium]|nr:hydrogenase expression/formation protein HypE [Gallionellaceae bacterium]